MTITLNIFLGLMIYLVGLNVAPIILSPNFTISDAQTFFSLICIMILLGGCFIQKQIRSIKNIPLGLFLIWSVLNTAYYTYWQMWKKIGEMDLAPVAITYQGMNFWFTPLTYNVSTILVLFNLICWVILCFIVMNYITKENVLKGLDVLRWIMVLTGFICLLEKFNLSEYYYLIQPESKYFNNLVIGFMGQPTMLSGIIGMSLPLFVYRKKWQDYCVLALLCVILCFWTGTTSGDPASTGIITGICSLAFYYFFTFKDKIYRFLMLEVIAIFGLLIWVLNPFYPVVQKFLNGNGRLPLWEYYFKHAIPVHSIQGSGLDAVNRLREQTPYPLGTHLHSEPLEAWLTLGVIGVAILGFGIYQYFKIENNYRETVLLKAMFFGFLVSCLFIHQAHIWAVTGPLAFIYGSTFVLGERNE